MLVHPSLCSTELHYLSTYKSKHITETWRYSKWEKPDTKGHLCDGVGFSGAGTRAEVTKALEGKNGGMLFDGEEILCGMMQHG